MFEPPVFFSAHDIRDDLADAFRAIETARNGDELTAATTAGVKQALRTLDRLTKVLDGIQEAGRPNHDRANPHKTL